METKPNYELAVRQDLSPALWGMIREMAISVHQARVFGAFSGDEIAVKMLYAHDLGLPLTSAIKSIFIVNQKPTIDTVTAMGLIFRSGLLIDMKETDLTKDGAYFGCVVWMKRSNGIEINRSFTLDDAKQADLLSKDNWRKYPAVMCNYRAKAFCARGLFPDVIQGLNFTEEFDVIEGQFKPEPITTPELTLAELLDQYTPEQIMNANDGKIPATDEEVQAVAARLINDNHKT